MGVKGITMDTIDKVLKLENDLEELENKLEKNQGEQIELRSIERSLKREIEEMEEDLEQLENAN